MKAIVVEDSQMVSRILKRLFQTSNLPLEPIFCETLLDAQKSIDLYEDIFIALVDLNLPDAPNGEIVDLMLAQEIPTVVLTASYDDNKREALLQQGIVDYIVKESRYSYEFSIQLIDRLLKNQETKILLAEDSSSYRLLIRRQLEKHLYQVIEARDGNEALEQLALHPDIKLLLTDYEMPNMDGVQLIQKIRRVYETADLKIIGLSAADNLSLSSKFIKNGANDFLKKPFNYEELHCRVMQNLKELDLVNKIRDAANRDFLTSLHNRRFLFEQAEISLQNDDQLACLAMMDLDLFKQINDNYGHDAGDMVLKQFGQLLKGSFERFLHARIGGEEFSVLLVGLSIEKAALLMERFCTIINETDFIYNGERLAVTVSIGLVERDQDTISSLITRADEMLYKAKEAGRNQVISEA